MTKKITWVIMAMIILATVAGLVLSYVAKTSNSAIRACSMEAKLCSDGSAVGRTGPSCEFAACPIVNVADHKSGTYRIDGVPVTLVNGKVETAAAPDSASKIVTQYFGNEATGDLNGDGIPDVAFLLTQERGGSGVFFYAAGALRDAAGGYRSIDATFLGDRIAPQATEIRDEKVIVNYAERKTGEPMTTRPSVGKSIWLKLDPKLMQFGEVVQNFEGESAIPILPYGNATLKVGESAAFPNFLITLLHIVDDSRCAEGVTCVWAGTLHAQFRISSGMGVSTTTIELGKSATTEVESIAVLSAVPYPKSGKTIAPADYVLTVSVKKR